MKRLKIYVLSAAGTALMLTAGCEYNNEEELYPQPKTPDTSIVSYAASIRPMIDANCSSQAGCHNPGGQTPDLSTYSGLSTSADRVKSRAIDFNPSQMPGAGPMSVANRERLGRWIAQGALNN